MLSFSLQVAINSFTAKHDLDSFQIQNPSGNIINWMLQMSRKTENSSLGNFVPVEMLSYSGSHLDLSGLTLGL